MAEKPTYEELEQRLRQLEDVEARRALAEEALETQRQELISIFDSIDEAIYVCDPRTHALLYVNAATKAIFGPDILGKQCYRVFQGLDEPCVFCTNPMIFGENLGKPYVWEFQNKVNGRWYRCIDKAIKWPDGRMVRYEMAIDIHDLKQAQDVLRESEERYRRITEAITDYIYTVRIQDGSAVETVHGAACEAVTGYTAENFSGNPYLWIQMVHENDRETVGKQATLVLSGVKAEPLEHRIVRKDGAVRWVRNTPVSNFDSDGRLLSYDGLIQDITERKQAEEALRESEANYRLLFSAESDAIIVVDTHTKHILEANDAALALYGYDRDEFLGLKAIEISAEPEESGAHIERVASGTPSVVSPGPVQRLHKKKDGEIFPVEISSGVYVLKDRRMVCAVIRDITERKQAEEALRKAHDQLEKFSSELEKKVQERTEELKQKNNQLVEAERLAALGKMANRVAHELRNPLTAVGGFARRINEKTPVGDPNKKYLQMIVEEVVTMESKVSEITRIQSQ